MIALVVAAVVSLAFWAWVLWQVREVAVDDGHGKQSSSTASRRTSP